MTDWELLNRYSQDRSQEAFGELARRHVDMVYNTALRQLRDPALAEDVTQSVFIVLMNRAGRISTQVVIGGWLFQVTRYAIADARKKQARRTRHEQEAGKMRLQQTSGEERGDLATILDELIAQLPTEDRDGIVLKYLEGRDYGQVAAALGTSEDTARKRLSRAIAKLRALLAKRGITAAESLLGTTLAARPLLPPPPTLLTQIQAFAGGTSGSATSVSIANEVIRTMKMQKLKIVGGIMAAAVLLTIGASVLLVKTNGASGGTSTTPLEPATQAAPVKAADGPKDVVIRAYHLAMEGDEDKFIACFASLTPQQETAMRSFAKAASAGNLVMEAVGKQFGPAAKDAFSQQALGVTSNDVAQGAQTINGDTAVVDIGNSGPGKIPMVKINGEWKISSDALKTFDASVATLLAKRADQLKQLAADINAGNYATVKQVRQALMKMMREAPMNTGKP